VITTPYRHPRAYRDDVEEHLQECGARRGNEEEHTHSAGSLQPLPILDQRWEGIPRGFTTRLPKMQGKDCIYVTVGRITKFVHISTRPLDYSAVQVTESSFREIFRLYGWPKSIVGNKAVMEYLVGGTDLSMDDATGENKQVLQLPGLKLLEDKQIWAGRTVMSRFL